MAIVTDLMWQLQVCIANWVTLALTCNTATVAIGSTVYLMSCLRRQHSEATAPEGRPPATSLV